jgi:hypothetical protein
MLFEITYSILFTLVIFLILRYSKIGQIAELNRWDLSIAFALKSLTSLFFIYIFTWHYGKGVLFSDAIFYITDGKILNNVFRNDFADFLKLFSGIGENETLVQKHLSSTTMWSRPFNFLNNDTKNLVRVNSLIHFFSFGTNYIHFIIFNLFTLFGITQIYLFFKKYISVNPRFFFLALFLFPSLLFWGSGVLKEPLLIFSIGLFFKVITLKKNPFLKSLLILISVYVLFNFKAYVVLCFILPAVLYLFCFILFKKKSILFGVVCTLFFAFSLILFFPAERQIIVNHISIKQFDFNNMGQGGLYFKKEDDLKSYYVPVKDASKIKIERDSIYFKQNLKIYSFNGSLKNKISPEYFKKDSKFKLRSAQGLVHSNSHIQTTLILSSTKQLIKNIPEALVNSLLRPFPTDTRTKFNIPHFLEVISIFGFLIFSIIFRKKLNRNEKYLVASLVIFSITLSLIIGWSTTIVGAIVRYRIPVYLALIILSFILFKPSEKWKNKEITS